MGRVARRCRVLAVGVLASATLAGSGTPGDEAVLPSEIAATVAFLASPELEGRAAAERGGAVASAYVASRFQALGWLPAGDDGPSGRSFFQAVPGIRAEYDVAGSSIRVERKGGAVPAETSNEVVALAASSDFRMTPDRSETIEVAGELVFAGFGIRAPEYGYDDYAGLEARGKIVLALSGEPGETDAASRFNGARPTRHLPLSSKRALAESLGAVALLVVPNPAGRAARAGDLLRGPDTGGEWIGLASRNTPIPVLVLEPRAATRMLEGSGFDLRAASAALEAGKSAGRPIAGRTVAIRLAFKDRKVVALRNVVARLGAGRGLDGEIVVLAAHWDHLGTIGGALHPGADDNATGIAGLLAVAAALRAEPPTGAREIVLAAWTGEERERLGSTYFTGHPVVPLDRIATAVNLDMLGRSNLDRDDYKDVLQVIYSAGAPALREIATKANDGVGFDLRFYGSLRFRPISDHASFHEAGVPIVYPFSGYHADYHGPGDTPDKVSPARVARASRYVARLVRLLAQHEGAIRLDPSIRDAPPPDPFEMPYSQ